MKRYMVFLLTVLLLCLGVFVLYPAKTSGPVQSPHETTSPVSTGTVPSSTATPNPLLPEDISTILDKDDTVPVDTIPSSYTALVNRNYLLPSDYIPTDLAEPNIRFSFGYRDDKRKLRKEAASALEKMFHAAEKKKIILYGVSGYRSYQRQKQIYDRNVAIRGRSATDTVSAMPGSSEHQTGLTIDISARSVGCRLDQSFGDTKEGRWVAKNAHKYGYIVRYPYGKSKITGYHYEPWHIRYVGRSVATYLYENNLTLEEHYGVSCNKPEKDTGVDVEEPDKVKYATPKPTKKPRPTASPKPKKTEKPKPTKTKKPKRTKKPTKTKPPRKTSAPKPTKKPDVTKKPVSTPTPTKEPAATPTTEE